MGNKKYQANKQTKNPDKQRNRQSGKSNPQIGSPALVGNKKGKGKQTNKTEYQVIKKQTNMLVSQSTNLELDTGEVEFPNPIPEASGLVKLT